MSKNGGGHKRPPLPVIRLEELLKPKQRNISTTSQTSTSNASNAEPVMDGITTTSGMELPFDIDDPSHDPIFQQPRDTAVTGTASSQPPASTTQALSGSGGSEKPSASAPESALRSQDVPGAGERNDASDMDISDEASKSAGDMDISDDASKSSTESEDSSIDIPVQRKRPAAQTILEKHPQGQEKSSLASQREKASTVAEQSAAQAPPLARGPAQASVGREESDKGNAAMEVESGENSAPFKPQERVHTSEGDELRPNSSSAANKENRNQAEGLPESPPTKRSRTEADVAGGTATNNSAAAEERFTPPLGETPRPRLDEEEQRLFDKIDRMILDDEWEELKNKIDGQILAAEEEDLLARIDQSIRAAEEASKPGGRVLYTAMVLQNGLLKEKYPTITIDPLLYDEEPVRKSLETRDTFGERLKTRVFDVEDVTAEVSRKARLPKYAEDAKERLLTREGLRAIVVDPIVSTEKSFSRPRKLVVRLDDAPDDPHSVILRCYGHPDLVKQVEAHVCSLIRAHQRRSEEKAEDRSMKADSLPEQPSTSAPEDRKRKQTHTEKQQKNFAAYQMFCESYKDVRELEYKPTGINRHRVNKSMWGRHKEIFGNACGEDCPCPRDLPSLTSSVVSSYIANEIKKDPTWKNQLRAPTGFVDCFAPKFFEKLEAEHADELPKQILGRLVLMWREHVRTKRFGTHCSKKCPCGEGWDAVFKRGRLYEKEVSEERKMKKSAPKTVAMKIPRRRPLSNEGSSDALSSTTTSQLPSASQSAVTLPGRIPRRPSGDHARDSKAGISPSQLLSNFHPDSDAVKPASVRIPRRCPSAEREAMASTPAAAPFSSNAPIARKTGVSSLPFQAKYYEIVFQPGEAMGFFCVNEYRVDGPVCKITSLNDSVKRMNPELQVGAVVTDVSHGGGHVQPVRTYTDLKKHFEKAKKSGTPIQVRFMNSPTSSLIGSLTDSASEAKGDWTASGEWVGLSTQGWAGGSKRVGTKDSQTLQTYTNASRGNREAEVVHLPSQQARAAALHETQLRQTTSHDLPSPPAAAFTLQYSTTMAPAKHRELPKPKPILRKPVDPSKKPSVSDLQPGHSAFRAMAGAAPKRNVRFSGDCEKRFYEPKTASFRMATEVSCQPSAGAAVPTDPVVRERTVPKAPGTKELIDAIKNKGYRDVIDMLQAGASPSSRDGSKKSPKDHVKERLEELKFERAHDPGNRELVAKMKDFELKRKVLSIYLDAIATIDKARFNKKWDRFNVQIDRIKDVCLSVRGAEHEGSQVLECRTHIKDEEMRPLPLIPMKGTIMHDWRNDESARDYSFNYNPHLTDPSRSNIVVSLFKGDRRDAIAPILLGEAVVPISRVSAAVVDKEKIVERLPPNEFLTSCAISIAASKEDKETHARKAKSAEVAGKLKEVIQWITQFNKETQADSAGAFTLSGDIKAPKCGISLLHAAIYLDEPDLVTQLMQLGANPAAPSDVGSARMLATNLLGDKEDKKSCEVLSIMMGNAGHEICGGIDSTASQESADSATSNASPVQHEAPTPKQATQAASLTSSSTLSEGRMSQMPPHAQSRQESSGVVSSAFSAAPGTEGGMHERRSSELVAPTASETAKREQVSSTLSPNENKRISMPVFDFWIDPAEENCRFFGRPGSAGCHRGPQCRYLHISPSVGYTLDSKQLHIDDVSLMNPDRIIRKSLPTDDGKVLYSAAYQDPLDGTLYLAEAGPYVGKCKEGVCWYSTEDEAIVQLKRVVAFHQIREHGIYGPQSSRPKRPHDDRIDSGHAKRARHERSQDVVRGATPPSRSLFARVLACRGGTSEIHTKIFGRPLRRTDWAVRKRGGLFTVELISPVDKSKRYLPTQEGGGKWMDGAFWFKDEKRAKASAFVSLLQSCKKYGLVNAECTMTRDGKQINM